MKSPRALLRLLALLLLLPAGLACATAIPAELFGATPPNARFTVSKDARYEAPVNAFRNLITARNKNHQANHFCLIGYEWPRGITRVWVHWQEEHTLIEWAGSLYKDLRDIGLTLSDKSYQLGSGTAASQADLQNNPYLVTEAWWHALANDCARHGEKYTVRPFKTSSGQPPQKKRTSGGKKASSIN